MTRKERTAYMKQWRLEHPDKVKESIRKQSRNRSMKKRGWSIGMVELFPGVRCYPEAYSK